MGDKKHRTGTSLHDGHDLAEPLQTPHTILPSSPPSLVDAQVTLRQTEAALPLDHTLWAVIRNSANAIGFDNYDRFISRVLCTAPANVGSVKGPPGRGSQKHTSPEDIPPSPIETSPEEIGSPPIKERLAELDSVPSIYGVDAYNLLKLATQAFLLLQTGITVQIPINPQTGRPYAKVDNIPGEEGRIGKPFTFAELETELAKYLSNERLPYLQRIIDALVGIDQKQQLEQLPYCMHLLKHRFTRPSLLELIWSYWNEEGMLVQTMNAVCLRFQNKRGPADHDPLANLEIDPLRPLGNFLWGYIQDEGNRLTIARRVYEYDHHYGLRMQGRAVPDLRSADSRSKFIEAFHNLLYRAGLFYREDADTTVIADGFPLLNSLREVHLLLAEGAHNQFGDLPWTSRGEMLMMQWMLARPEMREFLHGRAMVPYQERWMGQVDSMKKLQGWTDTSITHFRNLAVFGEQILLSVRYGDWIDINDQDFAKTWARYWRPEIQNYIHSYMSTTGVDLSEDIVDAGRAANRYIQPSVLLRDRLAKQGSQAELPSATEPGTLTAGGVGAPALPAPRRRALNPSRKD